MIRVVMVDDAKVVRHALAMALAKHDDVMVVAEASSGREALDKIEVYKPDVVALDADLPSGGGLATLHKIMAQDPGARVIMVYAHAKPERTLEALAAGAIDFVDRARYKRVEIDRLAAELYDKIHLLGERVRRPRSRPTGPVPLLPRAASSSPPPVARRVRPLSRRDPPAVPPAPVAAKPVVPDVVLGTVDWSRYDVCCVGASTGGPPAIERLLRALPADFRLPLLVVQHMPVGFTRPFAERLAGICRVAVSEAQGGEKLKSGMALIARAGEHLRVRRGRVAELVRAPAGGHVPSIDELMRSAASICGRRAIGVLLTGMGEDGAAGLAAIHTAGGLTIAEHEDSCVVYGMPRAAVERGAAQHMLTLGEICRLFGEKTK